MIDNHTLEVISSDFVPIVPYNTTDLSIGMAQRYDVIVTAKDLTEGSFWLRAIPQESCSESDASKWSERLAFSNVKHTWSRAAANT